MKNTIKGVDEYIERSGDFAKPILNRLRGIFHRADPRIAETIKWGFPHFEYKGIVGSMAAFKQYVSIGFWKGGLMKDDSRIFKNVGNARISMLKMRRLADVPPDKILLSYIREAVDLNERGVRVPSKPRKKEDLTIPDYLVAALNRNRKAKATFESFSQSHQREYVEWLAEAKRDETRKRRLETALQWLKDGKPRNWKYMR